MFPVLQYLIRDKPNRIRLTENALSAIVSCLLAPETGMQLEQVLVISSFLCALDIPDEDLPIIASSALLPALFLSAGMQCCENSGMPDIEKERNAICSTYHLHSSENCVAADRKDVNDASSDGKDTNNASSDGKDTNDASSDGKDINTTSEEEANQKNILLDNVIRFQFNLVLRSSQVCILIPRHGCP